jgi:hypothetical protein
MSIWPLASDFRSTPNRRHAHARSGSQANLASLSPRFAHAWDGTSGLLDFLELSFLRANQGAGRLRYPRRDLTTPPLPNFATFFHRTGTSAMRRKNKYPSCSIPLLALRCCLLPKCPTQQSFFAGLRVRRPDAIGLHTPKMRANLKKNLPMLVGPVGGRRDARDSTAPHPSRRGHPARFGRRSNDDLRSTPRLVL